MRIFLIATILMAAGLVLPRVNAQQTDALRKQFQEYKVKAEQGDPEAQSSLANCYVKGLGVAKGFAEAVKWYRKAAEQNQAEAQYNLGFHYATGQGVAKNETEAVEWFRKAAGQNHPQAQYNLGFHCLTGQGVPKNEVEAVNWFRKAAEQDHAQAQQNLSYCYANGLGVAKDEVEAAKWYRKAIERMEALKDEPARKQFQENKAKAEKGDPEAQQNLGFAYATGLGVEKNEEESAKWYRKAADQLEAQKDEAARKRFLEYKAKAEKGDAEAQQNLGYSYASGLGVAKDEAQAMEWYAKAAEKLQAERTEAARKQFQELKAKAENGDAESQHRLGFSYRDGLGVAPDMVEAVAWWRKSAEQNHAPAQYSLGFCYANGQGVAPDVAEAVGWWRRSAEQNYAPSQYNLGYCYVFGRGVTKDMAEAVKWWRKSAEQNHIPAQHNLGNCYAKGLGVAKDEVEAYAWWSLAAKTIPPAASGRDRLEKTMTPQQLAAASERTTALRAGLDASPKAGGK